MSKEYIFFILLVLTPILFYIFTELTLKKSILYIKRYSVYSRFSFYNHLKKNKIGIATYLEIINLKNDPEIYTNKEKRILQRKIISILKEFCAEYNFNLFYFSDEKYVLVNRNTNVNYHHVFDTLINNLNKPIEIEDKEIILKLNIGSVTSKSLPTNAEELLDIIISSCHIAKNRNFNYYLIIDLDNPNNVEKSYGIDDSGAIISHYMCIYDTKKFKIVGYETLARWKNKEKVLSPNVFIPLAIKRNLISNIDLGIAEDSFRNYLVLLKKNLIDDNFIMGINVAKESLSDSYVNRLNNLIRRYKEVPVKNVIIDIDMEVFTANENIIILRKLQELGFRICIDGITFNFDEVMEIHDKLHYDMIKITTNHYKKAEFSKFREFLVSRGVQVIATKVEKIDEMHALINSEFNLAQGFLYGKPSKFEQLVEQIWSNNVFRI
ncbi:EAL domain-containing protein [Mycoplasmatota bacterium WC44]